MRSNHVSTRGSASAAPATRCDALEPAGGAIGADDEVSFVRDETLADQPAHSPELRRNWLPTLGPSDSDTGARGLVGVRGTSPSCGDREQARLKYLVNAWGIERFRATVEGRLGYSLPDAEPVVFAAADDHLGWHPHGDGRWFLGVKVDNGRIRRLLRSDPFEQRQGALSR
jgi:hypothetical protein